MPKLPCLTNIFFKEKYKLMAKIWVLHDIDIWRKYKFLVKNSCTNWLFWPKFGFLTKIWIFDQNLDSWPKIWIFDQIFGFLTKNLEFWPNMDFDRNFKFGRNGFSNKITIFDQNYDFVNYMHVSHLHVK